MWGTSDRFGDSIPGFCSFNFRIYWFLKELRERLVVSYFLPCCYLSPKETSWGTKNPVLEPERRTRTIQSSAFSHMPERQGWALRSHLCLNLNGELGEQIINTNIELERATWRRAGWRKEGDSKDMPSQNLFRASPYFVPLRIYFWCAGKLL